MFLRENMFYIMRKNKHLFYFSKGTIKASTYWTIGDDLIPIVDLIQDLLPNKIQKKEWEFN
jgi:hypothetical protein